MDALKSVTTQFTPRPPFVVHMCFPTNWQKCLATNVFRHVVHKICSDITPHSQSRIKWSLYNQKWDSGLGPICLAIFCDALDWYIPVHQKSRVKSFPYDRRTWEILLTPRKFLNFEGNCHIKRHERLWQVTEVLCECENTK